MLDLKFDIFFFSLFHGAMSTLQEEFHIEFMLLPVGYLHSSSNLKLTMNYFLLHF